MEAQSRWRRDQQSPVKVPCPSQRMMCYNITEGSEGRDGFMPTMLRSRMAATENSTDIISPNSRPELALFKLAKPSIQGSKDGVLW